MDKDMEHLILELKKLLSKNYGDDFKKFYLVNLKEDEWDVLISIKQGENTPNGNYFKIITDSVVEDNPSLFSNPLSES